MSRRIDVDKTIDIIDSEMTMEDGLYNDGLCRAIQIIGERPTVKAIPIEWIEKWITYWERILPDWGAFQVCAAMLKDWEKENEQNKENTSQTD